MSVFNKPYRTDKQLEADAELKRKQAKMKNRETKNRLAQQIFEAVITEIEENDKDNFSKREMVALVAGETKLNQSEWLVWNNAATVAIQRIRRYFWSKRQEATQPCAFNYVNGRYYLIPLDDSLKANIVYDAYQRKMKGIAMKQGQLASSAYNKVLELDDVARAELIERLRAEKLLDE